MCKKSGTMNRARNTVDAFFTVMQRTQHGIKPIGLGHIFKITQRKSGSLAVITFLRYMALQCKGKDKKSVLFFLIATVGPSTAAHLYAFVVRAFNGFARYMISMRACKLWPWKKFLL